MFDRWSDEVLARKFLDACDDHDRVRQWKRETRSDAEKRRLRNRMWTIRRRMNYMMDAATERGWVGAEEKKC